METAKHFSLPPEPVDVSYVKELTKDQIQTCQWSTLDLCGPDSWTVILGLGQSPHIAPVQKHCDAVGVRLNVWRLGVDFEIIGQNWFVDELAKGGGLVIRPDQHILSRIAADSTGEDVIAQLNKHLGI
jgi:hypothetical protein